MIIILSLMASSFVLVSSLLYGVYSLKTTMIYLHFLNDKKNKKPRLSVYEWLNSIFFTFSTFLFFMIRKNTFLLFLFIALVAAQTTAQPKDAYYWNYDNIWIQEYYQNSYMERKYKSDPYRKDDGIIFGTDGKVYTFEGPVYEKGEYPYGKKAFKCNKAISGSYNFGTKYTLNARKDTLYSNFAGKFYIRRLHNDTLALETASGVGGVAYHRFIRYKPTTNKLPCYDGIEIPNMYWRARYRVWKLKNL